MYHTVYVLTHKQLHLDSVRARCPAYMMLRVRTYTSASQPGQPTSDIHKLKPPASIITTYMSIWEGERRPNIFISENVCCLV